MGRSSRHYATLEAAAWLRHQVSVLLATDLVPKRLSNPLFIPEGQLRSRWVLLRLVMVLDLWRAHYKPLTDAQAYAYQLALHVEMRSSDQQPAEWQYMGHLCATASAPRLRELYQELCLTGQVLVPARYQLAGEPTPTPSIVAQALLESAALNSSFTSNTENLGTSIL